MTGKYWNPENAGCHIFGRTRWNLVSPKDLFVTELLNPKLKLDRKRGCGNCLLKTVNTEFVVL